MQQRLQLKLSLEFHFVLTCKLSIAIAVATKHYVLYLACMFACYTYCQATEEVFDRILSDIIGQVAQEGRVRRAAGQSGPVDIGFTG